MADKNFFKEIYDIDVTDRMYDKNGSTYLPWATAFSEIAKVHPEVTYEFKTYGEHGYPYLETPLGLMVGTSVTIGGVTRDMILPVMDSSNKSMKTEEYTYKVKSGEKTVAAATMTDINKNIMRCFAKNLAMFGIGLHLWSKEEMPENTAKINQLRADVDALIKKKCAKEELKAEVAKLCKAADPMGEGRTTNIEDEDVLTALKKDLMKLR